MSAWINRRRQYGPYCRGSVVFTSWNLRFEQHMPGEEIMLKAVSTVRHRSEHTAQAACDVQVAKWQKRFPMLEIVGDDAATEPPGGAE